MELISWLISLIDEGLAVPAVAISIGSLMLAFPVRALAQGSLCQCTPLGEGVWGRWLGALLLMRIEVMRKSNKKQKFFNNSGATRSETAAESLFSIPASDL